MRNDPNIIDLKFPMDGFVVTFVDPWFVNAYGLSFMGATSSEAMEAAVTHGELLSLPIEPLFPFQIKEQTA